jgi:hypothetical protein
MPLLIGAIPPTLSEKLIEEYIEIKKRFSMNDWGPGQLKGGRFAEAILRILQHLLGETITPFGSDIPSTLKTRILNSVQSHATIDDHVRQKIVPLARLLLDFRNNRDAAHLGGFDANSMDTLFVMTSATWILSELVRVYGGYQMNDAQKIVDGLSIRDYPVIMERGGELFITRHNLTAKQEVLVLLTKNPNADYAFLFSKTRDRNNTRFRRTLGEMVSSKFIGEKNGEYFLMPRGAAAVTKESLLSYSP